MKVLKRILGVMALISIFLILITAEGIAQSRIGLYFGLCLGLLFLTLPYICYQANVWIDNVAKERLRVRREECLNPNIIHIGELRRRRGTC